MKKLATNLARTLLLTAGLGLLTAFGAAAQTFTKPIKVIVPYPAADLADTIGRLLQPKLREALGQPIIIDNRPGASGLIGLQAALQGEPDNHTFVLGQMGSMAVAPITNKQPFDVRKEFVPVAEAYTNYMLLVGNPALPAKTLPELIAYSKANPGKVRLATNGEGGFPHLAMELLRERTGIDFIHVPYKGSGQPVTDVIGGQVELTIAGFSSTYPQVQSGRLIPIAITGKSRTPNAPNVPTFGEAVPGYEALGWFGFFAPKGTSAAAINAFNAAVNNAVKAPEVRAKADTFGLDTVSGTPAQFGAVWQEDYDKWSKLIHSLKLEAK
jgi:tripartite-type tricarboxylate transporter receptor subunit TctC